MYAVIKADGRQFRVKEGDEIQVGRVAGKTGDKLEFGVSLISGKKMILGNSEEGAKCRVEASIEKHGKDSKIIVFKYKRRKNYKKKRGHRQQFSILKINKINA